ncbi:hypothetical protein D9613_003739 [Agrocybe pediades]|uniref:DUF6533 domain-containing protein n=1 Tax=Agrocybe pediades TaxID=84607 RepID=A0A8H4QIX1_9AGAR|nr:hypothetical protein D9613_003739 [Agrocybe pediades]
MDDKTLHTMVEQGMAVNLVGAACLTALVYDHILTLDQEVKAVWPARWSLAKFLFLFNRYPIAAMLLFNCISASRTYLPDDFCHFFMRWHSVVSTLSTITVQAILMLRVWALHRMSKTSLYIGFFFYIGGTITLIILLVYNYTKEQVILNDSLHSLPGCYAMTVPEIIAGQWITPLIVESVLFLLVISRAWFWWREGIAVPRIFTLLARDSALYFIIMFVMLLSNYLLFQLGPAFLSTLLVTPSTAAGCILGSHMILHLREMIEPYEDSDTNAVPMRRAVMISVTKTHEHDMDDLDSSRGTLSSHPPPRIPNRTFTQGSGHSPQLKPSTFAQAMYEKHRKDYQ